MTEPTIRAHWDAVGQLSCIVSELTPVTLHHAKGGSMIEVLGQTHALSAKSSDWLVLPVHHKYHLGEFGIDSGDNYWGVVDNWEEAFGTQVLMLQQVSLRVGYNVFTRAGLDYHPFLLRRLTAHG